MPGYPEESLLLQAVLQEKDELRMPMGKPPLTNREVETLTDWIREGARWPGEAARTTAKEEMKWWAYIPPRKVPPPTDAANPIDAFVAAKLDEKRLEPVPPAGRRTLIRRAFIDLHGLPPSAAEVESFANDDDPQAFAKLVDKLLESPRYGERWGRHWLDVVRYADTGGFETDLYFPNAWRYRDYVIKSFNEDKPYDRFVQEQIAGDEIWPDDLELRGSYHLTPDKLEHLEARIGTGMYTIGPLYHEAALDGRQLRYEWLTDAVDTTGAVFLGLTLGCARCHDHKFDPITQRDYHRMMAVFAGSEPKEVPAVNQSSQLSYYGGYPSLVKAEEYKDAIRRLDRAVLKRVEDKFLSQFPAETLDAYRVPEDERTPEQRERAATLERALTEAGLKKNPTGKEPELEYTPRERDDRERLLYELGKAALRARLVRRTASVLAHSEIPRPVHMTSTGDYRSAGERVYAGFPAVLTGGQEVDATEEPDAPASVAQHRKALANWLTNPSHPLTARVMVNRIWQGHFGRGIVATPNDFGHQSDPPTHQELLDWLAVEFVEQGGSVKAMHRLMMLSDAYQRASVPHDGNAAIDPRNRYLWRMNRRRLDAETLRDNVLAVSGALNTKMGGRPVVPPLSAEEMRGMWSKAQWPVSLDPEEHKRRSVYLYVKRSFPYPFLTIFDAPDTSVSCSRRDVTTVAPQALALLNSEFMLSQAAVLAERVRKESGAETGDQISGLWRLALGRAPDPHEKQRLSNLHEGFSEDNALTQLALLALNLNEFLYVD